MNSACSAAVQVAEKLARYRHAQLSAIKLAGDIKAKVITEGSLDELIAKFRTSCASSDLGSLILKWRGSRRVENRGRLDRGEFEPSGGPRQAPLAHLWRGGEAGLQYHPGAVL